MDILILVALILMNGVFAMAEIAVVSSNEVRLQQRADAGSNGARRALELLRDPTRFLSTVQIGITLVGVFAGAYGGATLAQPFAEVLAGIPALEPYSGALAFGIVVVAITYFSLVIGELVPKRIALNDPERIAALLAGAMHTVSVVATPFVRFLSGSTELVLRALGVQPKGDEDISEEEVDIVIAKGRLSGVIEPAEHEIIENAFWLGERAVNDIMTPRHEVRWLDVEAPADAWLATVANAPHARYLVSSGEIDDVVGFALASELLGATRDGATADLAEHVRQPLIVPESQPILGLLERFKQTGIHFAAIVDEYGSLEGIATLSDILEELVGSVKPVAPGERPDLLERDGVWFVSGGVHVDRLLKALSLEDDVDLSNEAYQTVGGLVANRLGRIPEEGDACRWRGYELKVQDMSGLRVERVRVRRADAADFEDAANSKSSADPT